MLVSISLPLSLSLSLSLSLYVTHPHYTSLNITYSLQVFPPPTSMTRCPYHYLFNNEPFWYSKVNLPNRIKYLKKIRRKFCCITDEASKIAQNWGCRHCSVDQSVPSILPPGFKSQAQNLRFHELIKLCNVERQKLTERSRKLAPLFKKWPKTFKILPNSKISTNLVTLHLTYLLTLSKCDQMEFKGTHFCQQLSQK